jgi:two-component system cell cycle sensor histidine kinase/response regulator CckA
MRARAVRESTNLTESPDPDNRRGEGKTRRQEKCRPRVAFPGMSTGIVTRRCVTSSAVTDLYQFHAFLVISSTFASVCVTYRKAVPEDSSRHARLARVAARAAAARAALVVAPAPDGLAVRAAAGFADAAGLPACLPADHPIGTPLRTGAAHRVDGVPGLLPGGAPAALLCVPVRAADGRVAASLCAVDAAGRGWTEEAERALADAAELASPAPPAEEQAGDVQAALAEGSQLRAIVESLHEALLVTDLEDRVLFASRRIRDVTGYAPEELVGRIAYEVWTEPKARPEFAERLRERVAGRAGRYLTSIRRKDGGTAWVEVLGSPLRDAAGAVVGTLGALTDVTARQRDEAVIRAQGEALDASGDGVALLEADGTVTWANAALARMHGAPSTRELPGRPWTDGYPAGEVAALAARCEEVARSGGSWRGEVRALRAGADGETVEFPQEVTLTALAGGGLALVARDLSAPRAAGDALRQSEEHFRFLIDSSADMISVLDETGRITYASPSFQRVLQVPPASLLGRSTLELIHRDDRPAAEEALAGALQHPGTMRQAEIRFRHMNGSWHTCELTGLARLTPEGARVVVNARDLSERRRAAAALRASEERFRILVDAVQDYAILLLDPEGFVVSWNSGAERIKGYPAEEVLGRHFSIFYPPDEAAAGTPARTLAQTAREGRVEAEGWTVRRDGSQVWMNLVFTALRDEAGRLLGFAEIARDLSERRAAEEAVRQSEARLAGIVSSAMDAIISVDADQRIVVFNAAAEAMFRIPAAEALGTHVSRFIPEHARETHDGHASRYVARGGTSRAAAAPARVHAVRADGEEFPIEATLSHVRAGEQTLATVIVRDVTERLRAEEALRHSEALLRSVLEGVTEGIFLKDMDGRYVLVNAAGARMMRAPAARLVGRTNVELWGAEIAHRLEEPERQVRETGETVTQEVREVGSDGRPRVFANTLAPYLDPSGQIAGVLGVAREITDQRALEEQFRQAQKMEAVGQLAGGVAHDFNNILMAVGGHVQLLLRRTPEDDPARWSLEEIRKGTTRAAALTGQLLAFSRRQVLRPRVLDLNAVVEGMVPMLERLIGADVELVTRLDHGIGTVRADPSQLEQVLMNLAVNARDAMPEGGVLVVSTDEARLTATDAARAAYLVPGPYVVLTVTDTGHGMEPATLERIFEPFFTTKEAGRGTGLGLATVYGIVKQSGGYVWADSVPGKATTFRVYLPRESVPATAEPEAPAAPAPRRGTETVLLAEDEPSVRALAATVLRDAGYTVVEAANGADALRAAEGHEGPVHLLLTDLVMPGMGGRELARRLREARPGLPVVFMSGYAEEVAPGRGRPEPGAAYVQKPIAPDELARRVRQALDEAREGA